ncbi:hypothetical protein [Natronospora cellulosivora (SeqCode)]
MVNAVFGRIMTYTFYVNNLFLDEITVKEIENNYTGLYVWAGRRIVEAAFDNIVVLDINS